jgi:hypothetical protein
LKGIYAPCDEDVFFFKTEDSERAERVPRMVWIGHGLAYLHGYRMRRPVGCRKDQRAFRNCFTKRRQLTKISRRFHCAF